MTLEQLLGAKLVIVALSFTILFTLERLRAAAPSPDLTAPAKSRLWRNGGLWLMTLAVSPLIVAPMTAWGANGLIWARSPELNGGAYLALFLTVDLILLDLWTYGLHRTYHRVPLMWRLHEVHHRDEFLDTTSAVRFHIGEVVLSAFLRLLPIALLAVPLRTVVVFEALLLCSALFHHSNVRLPSRFEAALSKIIVTPSIHWVHHHAVRSDTDSNYASILSVWDRVFGSRSVTQRRFDMKIGVESVEDKSLLGLILMPFMRRGPIKRNSQ